MTIPAEMAAVEIADGALRPTRRPTPIPDAQDVLIRVAAGVNRPDIMQRQGLYPPPLGASDLPGLEVAGAIAAVGADVDAHRIGERVCALLSGGGYAEYAVAPAALALPVPTGLAITDAAGVVETGFTVWDNLITRGALSAGERVLIHGGAGGIGTMAIQIARAAGARVAATAGSAEKARFCRALGAELAIDYTTSDFVQAVAAWSGGDGVDVILDMVGAAYFERNLSCLAVEGRLISIAVMTGAQVEIDLFRMMRKRWSLRGSTLRARSVAEKTAIAQAVHAHLWPLLTAGAIKAKVGAVFPLTAAAAAHARMESGANMGKIILDIA